MEARLAVKKNNEFLDQLWSDVDREDMLYLGDVYRLRLVSADYLGVSFDGTFINVSPNTFVPARKTQKHIKELLVAWYMEQAKKYFEAATIKYAELLNVKPSSITIKNYKARWGSCSAKGAISYNWRLILSPSHIIDYVVVHELCHMKELNHSPRYWAWVESILPDHKARRKWLRENGKNLII